MAKDDKKKKSPDSKDSKGKGKKNFGMLDPNGSAYIALMKNVDNTTGREETIEESLANMPLGSDFIEKARTGIAHAETALFEQAAVTRLRLSRLNNVTNLIEQKVLTPEVIDAMSPKELIQFYLTFHRLSGDLTKFLTIVHEMVSNENRWEYLKRTLEDAEAPETPIDELNRQALHSPHGKDVLHLVQSMIMDRDVKGKKKTNLVNVTPSKKKKGKTSKKVKKIKKAIKKSVKKKPSIKKKKKR